MNRQPMVFVRSSFYPTHEDEADAKRAREEINERGDVETDAGGCMQTGNFESLNVWL